MDYPIINILTGECPLESLPTNPAIIFPFPPDDFQNHSFVSIEAGHDVLVTCPTSSGKTVTAIYAVVYTALKLKKRVVFTTPIKVLSNQTYNDLKQLFSKLNIDVQIGLKTGDVSIDEDSQVLVATAEILQNSMYQLNNTVDDSRKKINKDFISTIGAVIMDEVHYFNDVERGKVWETMMILAPENVQLIMLSATLSAPEEFAKWISRCHQRPVDLITVEKRKVPLKHYLLINNCLPDALESPKQLFQIMDENNVYSTDNFLSSKAIHNKWIKERQKKSKPTDDPNNIPATVKWLKDNDMLQAIFFAFSKKECEAYANMIDFDIITHEERHEIERIFNSTMQPHMERYKNSEKIEIVKNFLMKGIAYHHSGMLSILKEIVEIIFKKGLAKILFCSETFAAGINCPCRTVVFTSMEKYTNEGKRFLNPAEYKQMAGRGGRRGLDTFGNVIILFRREFPDESDIKSVLTGKVPKITSHLKFDYQFFLKVTQSSNITFETFFAKSLANEENESILRGLKIEKTKLLQDIETTNTEVSKLTNLEQANLLICYEQKTSADLFGNGIKVSLPKKQQQEYAKLLKSLSTDPKFKTSYDILKKQSTLNSNLTRLDADIHGYENYVHNYYTKIKNLLFKWGYLTTADKETLESSDINVKGVIASNINECNPIILTEIICGNYLNGLTIQEIIGLVSIFTEPIKSAKRFEEQPDHTNIGGTSALRNVIQNILTMINTKQADEDDEFGVGYGITDWKISTDYVDIAFNWGTGQSVRSALDELANLEEHEGNFVKNMLKIGNIINDIKSMCKMIGKIELLPILEQSDTLILRDIVSVVSLYLK